MATERMAPNVRRNTCTRRLKSVPDCRLLDARPLIPVVTLLGAGHEEVCNRVLVCAMDHVNVVESTASVHAIKVFPSVLVHSLAARI